MARAGLVPSRSFDRCVPVRLERRTMTQTQTQIEKVSNIARKLIITVPAEKVSQHFQQGLASIQKTAKIKGFRPGHVPLSVVKQFYGDDLKHKVFHSVVDQSYQDAVEKHQLRPVSRPKIENVNGKGHSLEEGQDLTFSATFEIFPEFEVKSYTGLSLTRGNTEITDKDVQVIVDNLRSAHAEMVPVEEDRAVRKGDFVDFSFKGGIVTDSGVEDRADMSGQRVMEVGSGELIPGFEDELIGLKRSEDKTFRIRFPKEYNEPTLAGAEAEFYAKIHEIKLKKLPEVTDEWAKDAGYDSVEDLKKAATQHLTRERTKEVERQLKSDLLAILIEKNQFECPRSMIEAQARMLAQEFAENLKQQRFDEQMIQSVLQQEQDNLMKRAETQVRSGLILQAVAEKEGIKVEKAEIDAEFKKMAESVKMEEAKVREYYEADARRAENLEFRLQEEKTVAFILEKSKVKTK